MILEAKNLRKTYAGNVEAVRGVSFGIKQGICFGLLGPNGAGKTTTVEMLEGLLQPSAGEIFFSGEPMSQKHRQLVGVQFQQTSLPDYVKVGEILDLFAALYTQSYDRSELIRICSLEEILNRDTKRLSGGQRQRVLLALALVNDPQIIFLDEPTTGLDPQARRNFWQLIERIKSAGKTILMTTHYMDEADVLGDRIAIMSQGVVKCCGSSMFLKKLFGK